MSTDPNPPNNYPVKTNSLGKETRGEEYVAKEDRHNFFRMKGNYTRQYPLLNDFGHLTELSEIIRDSGCIAGSAVAFSILNQYQMAGDIDIFCWNHEGFKQIVSDLQGCGFSKMTDYVEEYANNTPFVVFGPGSNQFCIQKNIQVCKLVYYGKHNPEAVINSFDFTCTQFALYNGALVTSNKAIKDLGNRVLNTWNLHDLEKLPMRIKKYEERGFTVGKGLSSKDFEKSSSVTTPPSVIAENCTLKEVGLDLWSNHEYRNDYYSMDPALLKQKWG